MGHGAASGSSIETLPVPWRIESSATLADCFGGSHDARCFAAESHRQVASTAATAPGPGRSPLERVIDRETIL